MKNVRNAQKMPISSVEIGIACQSTENIFFPFEVLI
jgi:hypothetical protein